MYVNRVNGAWAEARQWEAPNVTRFAEVSAWAKAGEQFSIYKADAM